MKKLALLGGGGHASDLLGIIEACNAVETEYEVVGIFDDHAHRERFNKRNVKIFRKIEDQISLIDLSDASFVSAIGYPKDRLHVAHQAACLGLRISDPIIHPGAVYVGTHVVLGEGSVVHAGVSISVAATVGRHCYLSHGSLIGHDSVLGEGAAIMPGASLSGGVTLGTGVMVGSGAVVLEGVTIGDWVRIGANAVVTEDVRAGTTVVGVPAKPMRSS